MRCTNCAADLKSQDTVCPECGTPRPQLSPLFADLERRLAGLRVRHQSGELNEATFAAEVQKLALQDEAGAYWMLGADGAWHSHDGGQWVRRDPPALEGQTVRRFQPVPRAPAVNPDAASPVSPAALPAKRGLPWKWVAAGCAGLVALAVITGGASVLFRLFALRAKPQLLQGVATGTPDGPAIAPATTTIPPSLSATPTDSAQRSYRDDFADPTSGWQIGEYDHGSVGYGSGYYYVVARSRGKAMWGRAIQEFDNPFIDVDATCIQAPAGSSSTYGIGCRIQPNGDGYFLLISADGHYGIFKSMGDYVPLVNWTESGAIRQGHFTNHIGAMCSVETLALFVNGQLLATAYDDTFSSGDIALQAGTLGDEPTEVRFQTLSVREAIVYYFPMMMATSQ